MDQDYKSAAGKGAREFLSRERLVKRWQCGSDSFFGRHERSGLLVPRQSGRLLRYDWQDVFAFEGGPPPEGLEEAYRCDLLTETKVADLCDCSPEKVIGAAKAGHLATRRVGRSYRFVPIEVGRWQDLSWRRRRRSPAKEQVSAPPEDSDNQIRASSEASGEQDAHRAAKTA